MLSSPVTIRAGWLLLLVTSVIVQSVFSAQCPRHCVFALRRSLHSIVGGQSGSSVLAPFHHILANSDNIDHLFKQTKWTCFSITTFDSCLKQCPTSFERTTLLSSMGHWIYFCSLINKPSKGSSDVLDYIKCEQRHLRRARSNCQAPLDTGNITLVQFCKKFEKYQKCYQREIPDCTDNALEIKQKIDVALMRTYEKLLASSKMEIPTKCSAWRKDPPAGVRLPGNSDEGVPLDTDSTEQEEAATEPWTSSTTATTTATADDYGNANEDDVEEVIQDDEEPEIEYHRTENGEEAQNAEAQEAEASRSEAEASRGEAVTQHAPFQDADIQLTPTLVVQGYEGFGMNSGKDQRSTFLVTVLLILLNNVL